MTPEADKFWLDKAKEDRRKERNLRRTEARTPGRTEWQPILMAILFIAGFLLLVLVGNWLAGGDPGMPAR